LESTHDSGVWSSANGHQYIVVPSVRLTMRRVEYTQTDADNGRRAQIRAAFSTFSRGAASDDADRAGG
jgi:hypothetical protein